MLITNMTCTLCVVRAINAIGKEGDIPVGWTRKGVTEGVGCEHDKHLSKMKEWTSSYRTLTPACQIPREHFHKLYSTLTLQLSQLTLWQTEKCVQDHAVSKQHRTGLKLLTPRSMSFYYTMLPLSWTRAWLSLAKNPKSHIWNLTKTDNFPTQCIHFKILF